MKREFLLIAALFWCEVITSNVSVSIEEAQEVAIAYYQTIHDSKTEVSIMGRAEKVSLLGLAEMWLVPVNDNWILVSSDKRTEAILARFETQEKPDLTSYPSAAKYLISCYEHDIEYVRDSCDNCSVRKCWDKQHIINTQYRQTNSLPAAVLPLMGDIAWDQSGNNSSIPECSKVYNKFCPEISTDLTYLCNHAVAGCVAIAVGQIMRYWRWPYAADIPITIGGSNKDKRFYNWDQMDSILDNSSSMAAVDMVAGFIRDCGYDLDMTYGEVSSATDYAARQTFVNFGYDDNTLTHRAKWYTSGWDGIMRSELAAGRPVYYSGCKTGLCNGGHAFVLDGYDEYGLYHVNIGWGPRYNDYYYIDTITVNGSCYSHWQAAIWGIQPDPAHCTALTVTSTESPKFCIAQAGTVTLDGVSISNITEGKVYSAESIILTNGTSISNGSNVVLDIKPIPCTPPSTPMHITSSDINQTQTKAEEFGCLSISTQFTDEFIYIDSAEPIISVFLFNIDGRLLQQSEDLNINTTSIPDGIYVIKAISSHGQLYQTKILIKKY